MKKPLLLIPFLLLLGAGGYYLYRAQNRIQPNSARLSGNIEVVEVQLSFRIPGWVTQRPLDEGMPVRAGDLAAKLEPSELNLEIQQRQSAVNTAKAVLAELEAGSRPEDIATAQASVDRAKAVLSELQNGARPQEIATAQAAVDRAGAQLRFAQSDYDRMKDPAMGIVSESQRDSAKSALDSAKSTLEEASQKLSLLKEGARKEQIEQAKAALDEAQSRLTLLKNGARKEVVDQARARLAETEAALATSQNRLTFATLNAPIDGVVLSKNVEPGEFVGAGTPIVTLANLQKPWLRVYIPSPEMGKVKLNQKAKVTADAFPGKTFDGRVSFISSEAEFTPKSVQTDKERVKLVYRVKIDLDNPNLELKPGMPADAILLPQ